MKSLIEIFIFLIILILIVLSIWGGWLLENISTHILQSDVDINQVRFIPHRLEFKLYGINLPEKDILIPTGRIFLFPPRLEFYGLKVMDKILLGERGFSVSVTRRKYWEINLLFKGVDLGKLDYGFEKGGLSGVVDGIYTGGNCEFYGVLYLKDIIYSDSDNVFLGISSDELKELIEIYNGKLELDFTYKGPIGEITELYRYRPGKKTMGLVKRYILKKVFR